MARTLGQDVAGAFRDIPEVECVYVSREDDIVNVSIFVNERDENAYKKIYRREIEIEKKSREVFDFSVIARHNRPLSEFVGSEAPAWDRRAETERAY